MKILKILFVLIVSTITLLTLSGSLISKEVAPKSFENFSLYDYNQKMHSLSKLTNKKGIVIIFISTKCPVSNAYNNRMGNLYEEYGREFSFVGINSNKAEDIAEIKEHAADNNLDFVILKDSNNVIADRFEAKRTPEVYVLNNNYEQLYHGRIDDSRKSANVEVRDLKNVLEEIQAGKEITVAETKAFGCSIKRIKK